jgi:hypothetical protein
VYSCDLPQSAGITNNMGVNAMSTRVRRSCDDACDNTASGREQATDGDVDKEKDVRRSVVLNQQMLALLDELQDRLGENSHSAVLRRGVRLLKLVLDYQTGGTTIYIVKPGSEPGDKDLYQAIHLL